MPGSVFRRQGFSSHMYSQTSNLDYSLQQIPYPCPDSSYEYINSSDRLMKIRVTPCYPAKQTSKPIPLQSSVLPVPDLNDVDALLPKPRLSADACFNPDPRFHLFEQKSLYDKLPGSYVDQPLGSLYPNALHTELSHTLAEAWRFNPVALSNRSARETAFELARTPSHGINKEVISWVRSIGLSRMQAQSRERQADEVAAKECLRYEHYAEFHDDGHSELLDVGTLQNELDDFYDPPIGEADPGNPFDYRHFHNTSGPPRSPSAELHPVDGSEFDNGSNGPNLSSKPSSLPARRGWLGGMPAPISTTGPFKHSGTQMDHGYGAASLPTPNTGTRFAPANHNNEATMTQASSMISPPLNGVNIAPASHDYYGVMIPAGHPTPSPTQLNTAYSPPHTAKPVPLVTQTYPAGSVPSNEPIFEADVSPLRKPKQAAKRLALSGHSGESEWKERQEGPYDFSDFCFENSDLSNTAEPTDGTDDIDGAAPIDLVVPDANGMDGAASFEISTPDANDANRTFAHDTVVADDATDALFPVTMTAGGPPGAAKQDSSFQTDSLQGVPAEAIVIGNATEPITSNAVEDTKIRTPTSKGTPEQAMVLAQDLEESIHSAVSQTTSLTRVWGQPSPLDLPEPVVAVPKPYVLKKHSDYPEELSQSTDKRGHTETTSEHDENVDLHIQPKIDPVQTGDICHEPHQLRVNAFTTPVSRRIQNIQSVGATSSKTINLTPEYNSDSEDVGRASPNSLSSGVLSSPTKRTQGGQNALNHYVRETTSYPTSAAYDSMSMSMSISNASSTSPEPEDMALTPTHADFDHNHSTPSDPLEEVSLIDDSHSIASPIPTVDNTPATAPTIPRQSYTLNGSSEYSSYLNTIGLNSSANHAPSPYPTTPHNNSSSPRNPHTPFQPSVASQSRFLVLPPTTPCTPTPAQRASDQHHSKKPLGDVLRHKNPNKEKKMRKSVNSVFESKELGSKSPSPAGSDGTLVPDPFVMESGKGSIVKRTSKTTPVARTHSEGNDSAVVDRDEADMDMVRTRSRDQIAQAVVVVGGSKRKRGFESTLSAASAGEVSEGVQKRFRRSTRTSDVAAVEGVVL